MMVERVKILDLMSVLLSYLKDGVEAVDIKILPEENTLRVRPSQPSKKLPPSSPSKSDEEDDLPKIKPI